MFRVQEPTKERWIYIFGEDSVDSPDEFFQLVNEYGSQLSGSVIQVDVDDAQYMIDTDPLQLMFQWDSCFGITVVVPDETNIEMAQQTLINLCDILNKKQRGGA